MGKTVRFLGGDETEVADSLRFRPGDIIHKQKHHSTLIYLITGVEKRGEYIGYRYALYSNELFEGHQQAGWRGADYFEKRIETAGEEEAWIDLSMGEFEHAGHVTEQMHLKDIGGRQRYTFDFERFKRLLRGGFDTIVRGEVFYETAGTHRGLVVYRCGANTRKLADDMLKLRYFGENEPFVEHKKHVTQAIEQGVWVPMQMDGPSLNGTKETEL